MRSRLACILPIVMSALSPAAAWAQSQTPPGSLFTRAEILTRSDGTAVRELVLGALHGETAVLVNQRGFGGIAEVFEREPNGDHWVHTITLAPSDGPDRLGLSVATDGATIALSAQRESGSTVSVERAVYIFERWPDPAWQEVAKLTGDAGDISFGRSLTMGGSTTLFVESSRGVLVFERMPTGDWRETAALPGGFSFAASDSTAVVGNPSDAGAVYVFERNEGGPNAWGQVAQLTGPPQPVGTSDQFGRSVALDRETVLVSAELGPDDSGGYVFSRLGDHNAWQRVATLSIGHRTTGLPLEVAINKGGTAFLVAKFVAGFEGEVHIFRRHRDVQNAWEKVAVISTLISDWSVSDNLLVLGGWVFTPTGIGAVLHARNQGGEDAWGEVGQILSGGFLDGVIPFALGITGDTALVGGFNSSLGCPGCQPGPIGVYVSDLDRDGLRDGIDPCPRDPLNNVVGGCTRDTLRSAIVDDAVALEELTVVSAGNPFVIRATFTNQSGTDLVNPFFEVIDLSGANALLNADGGPGGVGATLSLDVGDGVFSAGESFEATFVITLDALVPFTFRVMLRGDPAPSAGVVD